MKSVYDTLPKLKVELSFIKILVIIITFTGSFLIPAELVQYSQISQSNNITAQTNKNSSFLSNTKGSGQVAGVSTQKNTIDLPFIGLITIDLNSQDGILIIVGFLMLGISTILIIYLVMDNIISR